MTSAVNTAAPSTAVVSHPVLNVVGLRKQFKVRDGGRTAELTAVDDVDLAIAPGETVALVGESGSGKSTLARCVTRLVDPTSGSVELDGLSLGQLSGRQLSRAYRDIQMVFQDPRSSLNPRMTVGAMLEEPLRLLGSLSAPQRGTRVAELLTEVGLPADFADRRPHQLSGGQRQRIGIARALAVDPKVVVLDEPTASLDVSVRGQVLELLARIQAERNVAYLFITHDLQVVRSIADRVLVMYLGGIVEEGPTERVFSDPVHPYTKALISAAPVAEWGVTTERFELAGEIPSPLRVPPGCRLAGRCPVSEPDCSEHRPALLPVPGSRFVACPPEVSRRGLLEPDSLDHPATPAHPRSTS
ncbi:ABC transporter ATP-binding protein [Nakamurella leprariae]|uniref:ATP-binding cassette domain-containing protein n=1 Tax=Nakamurella leprariae TaxID=2803911 RepID=A0A939BUT8_9ACTN|nr:oligopeptide/dipeptide ABC transporter ATP-binding protein [Nakamurella leprariae]MBM9465863.1 ATP-binding cassette domain-containing protein [Nakamurella leprariae]